MEGGEKVCEVWTIVTHLEFDRQQQQQQRNHPSSQCGPTSLGQKGRGINSRSQNKGMNRMQRMADRIFYVSTYSVTESYE
eukprot:scaffold15897_cov105-Skeletonema_dohrnii-CCMP3373.AAC.2